MTQRLPFRQLLNQGVGEGATPFFGVFHFTLDPYFIILRVKQGGIKYHFLSLWYDSTWDWTQVSQAIGKHSNHHANYTRMLCVVLNKSWKHHPTKQQLYGYLPSISQTIQVRRARHVGYFWRSKDKLISDIFLWTPKHGNNSVGRLAKTYIHQLCVDTRCRPEDLPRAMVERWEKVKGICAVRTPDDDHDDDSFISDSFWLGFFV